MWRTGKAAACLSLDKNGKDAKPWYELFGFYLFQKRQTLGFTSSTEKGEVNKLRHWLNACRA